jgi:hypothetical protein
VLEKHLAMRGGTVLHKAHLAPAARYSEDIDLVLVKAMDPGTLDQHLRRVLTPVLGQPADSLIADAWLAIRNVLRPSKILRTAYKFVPLGLRREEVVKVEVNLNENASLYPLVSVELDALDDDGDPVRAMARSYGCASTRWPAFGDLFACLTVAASGRLLFHVSDPAALQLIRLLE